MQQQLAVLNNDMEHIKSSLGRIELLIEKQNGRVRKLELWRSFLVGLSTALVALGGVDIFTNAF